MQPLFLPYALGGSFSPPSVWRSYIFIAPFRYFQKIGSQTTSYPSPLSPPRDGNLWAASNANTPQQGKHVSLPAHIHTSRVQQQYSHLDDTLLNGSRHSEKRKGEGRAAIKIICSEQKHTIPLGVGALKTRGRWGERIPRMPKAFRNSNRSCQSVDLNVMNTQDNIQN